MSSLCFSDPSRTQGVARSRSSPIGQAANSVWIKSAGEHGMGELGPQRRVPEHRPEVVNPDGDVLPCPVALDYLLMAIAGGRSGPPALAVGSGAVPRQARRAGTEVRTT